MADQRLRESSREAWALAAAQHWVLTRQQLLGLGFTAVAIKERVRRGRLSPVARGVYAVGRPQLTRHGHWMAAVLSCGPHAVLSYGSAAALWEFAREERGIEVSVPGNVCRRRPGVTVHRRNGPIEATRRHRIPVTTVVSTLVDLATRESRDWIEAAINEADIRRLTNPPRLRAALDDMCGRHGAAALRHLLDRRTFRLTRSALERLLIPIALAVGLPLPLTRYWLNGYEVDFYWPDLGLVVETDGLTYHRTPARQAADRRRDQAHAAAGLTCLRFTHEQIVFEPEYVRSVLEAVVRRLLAERSGRAAALGNG